MRQRRLIEIQPHHITTKTQFVAALREFVKHDGANLDDGYGRGRSYRPDFGETFLMDAFATYLEENTDIPDRESGVGFPERLHLYVVEAFDAFFHAGRYTALRTEFRKLTGDDLPSLTDIRFESGAARITRQLRCLLPLLCAPIDGDLEERLVSVFTAERRTVWLAWRRFVRTCYADALRAFRVNGSYATSAVFGGAWFEIGDASGGNSYCAFGRDLHLPKRELFHHISAVTESTASDADRAAAIEALLATQPRPLHAARLCITFSLSFKEPLAQSAGISHTELSFLNCIDLINEVVDRWDATKLKISSK